MSNKKELARVTPSEANKIGIVSLSDRPNAASRYGDGGLTAKALKERFDALPNLVREKFNIIADMLASEEAARYVTIGNADGRLGETLYDFLQLFGERGDGISDKNISDYIEALYQMEGDEEARSYTLGEIILDIHSRLASADNALGGVDDKIEGAIGRVLNTEV